MSSNYKKRVINESDDDEESGSERGRATHHTAAVPQQQQQQPASSSALHQQAVETGSAILKEAAHHETTQSEQKAKVELEDAETRHEVTASGFPTTAKEVAATSVNHHIAAEDGSSSSINNKNQMDVDPKAQHQADSSDDDDDDRPLSAKFNNGGGSSALPNFKKTKQQKSSSAGAQKKDSNGDVEMKGADSSDDDDDKPLAARASTSTAPPTDRSKKQPKKTSKNAAKSASSSDDSSDDDDDDDKPLAKKVVNGANKSVKQESDADDSSSDDDVPLAKKKAPAAKPKPKPQPKKRAKKEADGSSDEEAKPAKKRSKVVKSETPMSSPAPVKDKGKNGKAAAAKKEASATPAPSDSQGTSKGGRKGKTKAEEDENRFKWWEKVKKEEDGEGDDSDEEGYSPEISDGPKWTTLEHNGVMFAPDYVPLPGNVKLKYKGKPVDLPVESEEVAGFYGAMLETEHAKDATFQKNFFKCFLEVLEKHPPRNGIVIGEDDFAKLDFTDIFQHYEAERIKRKERTKDEKKLEKEQKDKIEEKYKTCLVDGRVETVGNFRLEPPGLFRGRGEHPKKGMLKTRLQAEDITINIGKEAKVPEPPPGHKWARVQHDPNVTWLATWKENINGNTKYVFLSAGSVWKGQSDLKKFEKARKLKDIIGRIRKDYEADLTSKVMTDRQRATAVYLIDKYALRVGGEKQDDEADTVGCCSLRFEHITLKEPNLVTFDFLGKDSIRFYQPDKEVIPQVFKNLKLFKKNGGAGDELFDRISPQLLNKYFHTYMDGLTAKVFRTYNASYLLQIKLKETPKDATVADKILHYNRANRLVAELCNHQRAAPKTHGQAMEKLSDKVKALKYQRMKLRYTLFEVDPDNKKKHKKYKEMESDLDDEWCEKYEKDCVEKERAKIRKKWEKDNEKLKADGQKEVSEKELEKLLKAADEYGKEIKRERVKKSVEPKKGQNTAKVLDAIIKMDQRIEAQKIAAVDREEGKEISLTTSKINYMDPRITAAWCKKHDVPLEKMFSKTLRTKFAWAMEVDEDWEF